MQSIWARYRWLIAFTVIYLIAASFAYLQQGNKEFMGYLGVTIVVGALILGTIEHTRLDRLALWGLSIAGLLHMLGGLIRVDGGILYDWELYPILHYGEGFYVLRMDQVIHLYGYAIVAITMHQLIAPRLRRVHVGFQIIFAWAVAVGLGAVNEVIEFFAFLSLEETGVGDYYNTILDLIFNLLGGLTGALVQQARRGRR